MTATLKSTSRSEAFPGPDLRVLAGACSITGTRRDNNEDVAYISPDLRVFIVADGMGGHDSGEVASRFAVDALSHELAEVSSQSHSDKEVEALVREALTHAHCLIASQAEDNPELTGADTTVVLALVFGSHLFVTGVGDSRAYLIRRGGIQQLTTDDSWPQLLLQAGVLSNEEAKRHCMRHVLLSSLAMPQFEPNKEIRKLEVCAGDRFLLCSDGLTNAVDDAALQEIMLLEDNPQQTAEALVQRAVEKDAGDDVTCLVLHVVGSDADEKRSARPSLLQRMWRALFGGST